MKYIFFFFSFFSITILIAQKDVKDAGVVQDSVKEQEKDLFIANYNNQLNIKFEVSNEIQKYVFPFHENTIELVPNLGIRYALVFNYRFLSVRLGIRSQPSKESEVAKGDTDLFTLGVKLLYDKWSHDFEFIRAKGFYVRNSDDLDPIISEGDRYVQFPDLTTYAISGTSAYKFNANYSVKAALSQTEIQLKSAGTFMPSIDYWLYLFNGADRILDGDGDEIDRIIYSDYHGLNSVLNIGYYYSFIIKKWYFNVFAAPGIGIDMYTETRHSPAGTQDQFNTDLVLSIQSGAGVGYNSDKYYFGVNYSNRYSSEFRYEKNDGFKTVNNSLFIFFGYRFKAPKTLSKPVDYIEEKVPLLKDDKS